MIVDDDPLICEGLAVALGDSFEIHQAGSRVAAIDLLRQLPAPPQLALIDLGLPPTPHRPDEGFYLIAELLAHSPKIRIFVLSGQDEQSNARHARALGATDFIAKPCQPEKIRKYLADALSMRDSEHGHDEPDGQSLGIVGQSPAIQALRSQIVMYAPMPYPVLIEGESGCGKELVAAALQKLSGNPGAPFKLLNCAAIAPTLIEPTLFGHSKGAFTGATSAQTGFFEDASSGTLLLDEIGELPMELQTKLLRVLENGEYQRIGETATRKSHARIIAATNRNLRNAVRAGTFRDDLYHRLNVFSITVPPLRELGRDKLTLLNHFRAYYAQQTGHAPFELDTEALRCWEHYSFPGNTRELRNIVIRLSAKHPGRTVGAMQLQEEFDPLDTPASRGQVLDVLMAGNFNLDHYLREQEGYYIAAALELAEGNISEAAKLLGINRTTLHSRIDAHEKQPTG
ncbi:MAG: sigma-54-dependent Fis family transcriptional regulator [Gallionellales bacterium RIFCSPLOWO2_12_FULL_59_22]|nr:MAG: sigma-54-dependent Fis family transcriptional regulator [Gallionellales bacterium RIFCSPLOWO2_02_FULL_59_110]OGT04950.1 MAG: sigma-54-dependent Fis family transcriptional regulator [Gallionellales bacterium RIFCSPLOWO2_02_58_13]OGT12688.1 MAG: sigma-54-dependent Fis family transcriptional regulator [Gallionellales bacterium RIFCSPLOWO2_12_FULL_59_22]